VTIRPDVVSARLLAALEADLVGPFAAGVPGADLGEHAGIGPGRDATRRPAHRREFSEQPRTVTP